MTKHSLGENFALPPTFTDTLKALDEFYLRLSNPKGGLIFNRDGGVYRPELDVVFTKELIREASRGNLEVLKTNDVLVFLESQKAVALLVETPYVDDVFRTLCDVPLTSQSIETLGRVLTIFTAWGSHLNASQASWFWDRLKACIANESIGRFPVSNKTQGIMINLFSRNLLDPQALLELSKLIYVNRHSATLENLSSEATASGAINSPLPFFFDAPPYFVAFYNTEFYEQQLKLEGVDPAAAEILLHDWSGDFTSLLVAAKTLSSDS